VGALIHAAPGLPGIYPAGMHVVPALHGRGRSGHVAITFDDGPDPASTPAFLHQLDQLGWHATFFMLGSMARQHPTLVAEVAAAGHEIGVHGDEHRNMLRRSPWSARADVVRCRDLLADLSGQEPLFFRPPFGTLAFGAFWGAKSAGLTTVLWTNWGRDWRGDASPDAVAAEVLARDIDGGTVLLHDSDCQSDPGSWRNALGALPILAEALAARDLAVGPLRDHGLREARRTARV
jgi:peptidoglycan/xylan/chitin deacetylase (PgdA/CDA1 family)